MVDEGREVAGVVDEVADEVAAEGAKVKRPQIGIAARVEKQVRQMHPLYA